MNIKINKEFIKELKKELRNKNNGYCGTYIRIDVENNLIMFSFDRYNNKKYSTEKETKQSLSWINPPGRTGPGARS